MEKTTLLPLLVIVLICGGSLAKTRREGKASHVRVERAIGGERFRRGEWPGLVLLRATIVTRRFLTIPISHIHLYCGGALISDRWILSAAHCFMDNGSRARRASNWEARLATIRLRGGVRERILDILGRIFQQGEMRHWEIDVERIVPHPNYNASGPGFLSNDIALIKLSESVPTSSQRFPLLQSTPLPTDNQQDFPSPGAECVTTGWGCTSAGGRPASHARQINMPVYANGQCQHSYGLSTMDKRICAGHWNNSIGVCQGDSGSPLMCRQNGNYTLAGLVSFTSRDHPESFPAVFSRVSDYLPWIRSVMQRY